MMSTLEGRLALILIDVQNSFVAGYWRSFLTDSEILPIKKTFEKCGKVLQNLPSDTPVLMTQCPFINGKDREFDPSVKDIVEERKYPVIYKYDTNIMDAEGIDQWMKSILDKQVQSLLIGGCTITSCVRVSSINLKRHFLSYPIEIVVDLSLCGARQSNYEKRCRFCMSQYMAHRDVLCGKCDQAGVELLSPVDKAVESMRASGVKVIESYDWENVEH